MTARRIHPHRPDPSDQQARHPAKRDSRHRTSETPAYTGFGGNADFGADSPAAPRAPEAPVSDSKGFGQYAGIGQSTEAAPATIDPSSESLHNEIHVRFKESLSLDSSGIEVSVLDGVVTLEGTIDSMLSRQRAEELCETVAGVRSVRNNLRPIHAQNAGHTSRRS